MLYVDTKGDFSSVRIQRILDERGYSHKVCYYFLPDYTHITRPAPGCSDNPMSNDRAVQTVYLLSLSPLHTYLYHDRYLCFSYYA